MKKSILFILVVCPYFIFSQLKPGVWRGVLTLSEKKNDIILPFNFMVTYVKDLPVIEIHNAEEKIKVTEITMTGDSVNFKMPVFDTEFKTKLSHDTLSGIWINHAKTEHNVIPFEAFYGEKNRFATSSKQAQDFSGRYKVTFNPGKEDEYKAIGIFKQNTNVITGTFLTETGDYRYLEGVSQENNMTLSCFDGAHAFLFFANSQKKSLLADSLSGVFFAGISGKENWVAYRNDTFQLRDPETMTYLKNPDEKITFSFKNTKGETVSLSDKKFENKVVMVQVMGSWCPNCMDETAYLTQVYKQYKNKGLEIVALAYERTSDFEKAKQNVLRLKTRFGAEYEFLITGLTGSAKASESLPFLNKISAFPTTIILDKSHQVKTIYTGFSGPATGKAYEQYKKKTENLLQQLLLH